MEGDECSQHNGRACNRHKLPAWQHKNGRVHNAMNELVEDSSRQVVNKLLHEHYCNLVGFGAICMGCNFRSVLLSDNLLQLQRDKLKQAPIRLLGQTFDDYFGTLLLVCES